MTDTSGGGALWPVPGPFWGGYPARWHSYAPSSADGLSRDRLPPTLPRIPDRHRQWPGRALLSTLFFSGPSAHLPRTACFLAARSSVSDEEHQFVVRYNDRVTKLQRLMKTVDASNTRIDDFKAQLEASDVEELRRHQSRHQAIKIRHSPDVISLCDEYLTTRARKVDVESARVATRLALDEYRRGTFNRSQETVNRYLATFGAHFRLGGLKPVNIRRGSTTTYGAIINKTSVGVFGNRSGEPEPSFRTVFSVGDRATLARDIVKCCRMVASAS